MDIREMKAGKELDCKIAEIIFGYKRVKTPKDYDGQNGGTDVLVPPNMSEFYNYPPRGEIPLGYFTRNWSTDLSEVWEVAEMFQFHLENVGYGDKKYHVIIDVFNEDGELSQFEAFGETIPLTICRCALLAKEES